MSMVTMLTGVSVIIIVYIMNVQFGFLHEFYGIPIGITLNNGM